MRRSDEAIERVFAGLRDVEAPAGMERRILEGAEGRAAERVKPAAERFWAVWRRVRLVWLVAPQWRMGALPAVGCAVVAGMMAVAVMMSSHRRASTLTASEMGRAAMKQAPVTAASSAAAEAAEMAANEAEPLAVGAGARPMHKMSVRGVKVVRDEDSVAVREMRAASHPAPPPPLTEQEKMLLRVAQVGDPQEMAMLNPEIRAKKEAQSDQEFQRFFERATATDNTATDNE
jgi:hypothetical protein